MKSRAVTLVACALAGCTSVPLATMARFSAFDESQFARLDPRVMRVRVSTPADCVLDAGDTRLTTSVQFGSEKRHDDFRLEQVSLTPSSRNGGFFSGDVPVASYELKLTEPSVAAFRQLQNLARPGNLKSVDMNVQVSLKEAPPGATRLRVWVDMLRGLDEGWFTLIDGGSIEIAKTTKYGRK